MLTRVLPLWRTPQARVRQESARVMVHVDREIGEERTTGLSSQRGCESNPASLESAFLRGSYALHALPLPSLPLADENSYSNAFSCTE